MKKVRFTAREANWLALEKATPVQINWMIFLGGGGNLSFI